MTEFEKKIKTEPYKVIMNICRRRIANSVALKSF